MAEICIAPCIVAVRYMAFGICCVVCQYFSPPKYCLAFGISRFWDVTACFFMPIELSVGYLWS